MINDYEQLIKDREKKKVKTICEDIEVAYCPYQGGGKSDKTKLREFITQL